MICWRWNLAVLYLISNCRNVSLRFSALLAAGLPTGTKVFGILFGWHKCFIIVIFLLQCRVGGTRFIGTSELKGVVWFFFHLLRAAFGNIDFSTSNSKWISLPVSHAQCPEAPCEQQIQWQQPIMKVSVTRNKWKRKWRLRYLAMERELESWGSLHMPLHCKILDQPLLIEI